MHNTTSFDWDRSALGARATWPPELRLAVELVLNTPLPMILAWGPRQVAVYNEAYARLTGAVAPGATDSVQAAPPFVHASAALHSARAGASARAPQQQLALGGPAAISVDLYYTPVLGADGQPGGIVCALAPAAPALAEPGPARALRILVVEDNLDALYLVCEMLKAFGHSTAALSHGEDALALLAREPFDVLFSDVSLPGMSGVDLARAALALQSQLQIIFASGYGDALLRTLEFPFHSLQKPYDIEQLQAALSTIADSNTASAAGS